MAFSSVILGKSVFGNKKVSWGTWDSAGVATGDIDTGMRACEFFAIIHTGAAVEASVAVVNETMPCAGNAVTIVTTSGDTGLWFAIGHN